MKLTREQAYNLTFFDHDPELGLTVEARVRTGERRWVSEHLLVVKDSDGKLWAASYEQGLTEYQDIEPFEYMEFVHFTQVAKIPVTTYEYKGMGVAE